MDVQKVKTVKQAEIDKEKQIIDADAQAKATERQAEGQLAATLKQAEGITATGSAEAAAETAKLLAPVTAQTTLAKEIGSNDGYQKYLVTIEQVKVGGEVGKAMAASLEKADLKIIANSGNVQEGVSGLTSILTPGGGTSIAGMLTALAQTEEGKQVLDAVTTKVTTVKPKKAA
jgi:flotillin